MTATMVKQGIDYEASCELADEISARASNCWGNSLTALRQARSLKGKQARYVEGWAVDKRFGMIYEHGWIELGDGTVLDATAAANDHYLGSERYDWEYFPG